MGSPASLARFVSRLGPRAQLISTLRALRAFTGTSRTPPGYPSPSPRRKNAQRWYRNVRLLCIGYACRPRLRTRLTRGRRTWPRNPWSSSGRDPHPSLATHVCILTPTKSTARLPGRFAPRRTLSYPATMKIAAASSVVCLSPATLSARNH